MPEANNTSENLIAENQRLRHEIAGLSDISSGQYQHIFNNAPISLWKMDCIKAKKIVDDLIAQGVENIHSYLLSHPKFVFQVVRSIEVLDVNDQTPTMFEAASKKEFCDSVGMIFTAESIEAFAMLIIRYAEGAPKFEMETLNRTLQGKKIHTLVSVTFPSSNSTFNKVIASVQDITDRKQMEEQAKESKRELDLIFQHLQETFYRADLEGKIIKLSPSVSKLMKCKPEDLMGKMLADYYIENNGREKFLTELKEGNGEVFGYEAEVRRLDGMPIWISTNAHYYYDKDGNLAGVEGTIRDVTSQKKLEVQLQQAQKMEAIGTLVGGIAHDFNNMLAGMTGNLYLAKQQTWEMPDVVQNLSRIEELSFRAADMIQQLLTFARKSMMSMKPISLTPFIKEIGVLLRLSVPENVIMHQEICSETLKINGDGTQLHQVLMNLVNNARDAVKGVKEPLITVRLEAFRPDDAFIKEHAIFNVGQYAHLSVQDNGCGIPESQIEHLFEPFFTTKEQGKGTGLGLAMVFGAVKSHQGFVEVESIEGEGAMFHVYIPLLESEADTCAALQGGGIVKGHGELILLVDDEQQIIETGKEVLESLGYQVLTARDGQQAVETFAARFEDIDLCLFDVVMPFMGGDQAAKNIRIINPEAKIIFVTGYDKNLLTDMAHETVLIKPFSIEEMSGLIRKQLDS